MENKERRDAILAMLKKTDKPVTGTEMAKACQVSRQIIVGILPCSGPVGHRSFPRHGDISSMNSRNMGSRNLSFAATARIRWKRN